MVTLLLAQAAQSLEPPPAGWGHVAESTLRHAEQSPAVFFAIAASVLPLGCVGLVIFVFFKWGIPVFREEARLGREHLASLLKQRGEESAADIAAARELAREQNRSLIDRVELKVDGLRTELGKTDERLSRLTDAVSRVASKVGALMVVLMAFVGGAMIGAGWSSPATPAYVVPAAATSPACFAPTTVATESKNECAQKPCARGTHCCGQDKCCPDKSATALEPHSALAVSSLEGFAEGGCDPRLDACAYLPAR